jgi:hypothetical protein
MAGTGLSFNLSIGYRDLFDDYETVDIKGLIEGVPTVMILKTAAFFLAQLHTAQEKETTQIEFLRIWTGRAPLETKRRIIEFIANNNLQNRKISFLNNYALLILTQYVIANSNQLPEKESLTEEEELGVLRLYLYLFQTWLDNQQDWAKAIQLTDTYQQNSSPLDRILMIALPSQIAIEEINKLKDFRIQFEKARYFFDFCESNEVFRDYLSIFLEAQGFESWQKYLKFLFSIYVRPFTDGVAPSIIQVSSKYLEIIAFLDTLSIDVNAFRDSNDFAGIRGKPIYKSGNDYIFLNLNFFVDRIYQGIQFMMGQVLVSKGAYFGKKKIRDLPAFLSIFGDSFSENHLLYQVMNFAFARSGYKIYSGEQIKALAGDGGPDFYIRDKSKVYVIEFKNVYIAANAKYSNSYETVEGAIFNKFVQNERGDPKGVRQLANVIEKLKNGFLNELDGFDFSQAIIYPIIIYVDGSLDLAGINYILNEKFQQALSEKDRVGNGVMPLTFINLDIFIKYQDLFREKKIKMNNLLNEYTALTKHGKNYGERLYPFEDYMSDKVRHLKFDSPKKFMADVLSMIEAE